MLAKLDRLTVPVYVFTGWQDMYSRGDLRLIDGLPNPNKLLVIDPTTHHGAGNAGQVGAPYDDGSGDAVALGASPPKGEDVAWLNRFLIARKWGASSRSDSQKSGAAEAPRSTS